MIEDPFIRVLRSGRAGVSESVCAYFAIRLDSIGVCRQEESYAPEFARIGGNLDKSRDYLAKFQAMRALLLPQLLEAPGWLTAGDVARWGHDVHESTQVENSVFTENLSEGFVARLVECGLIPL